MSLYYLGNENLKGLGVPVSFTENQFDEFFKCKTDPIYFIKNFCKIVSLDFGLIPFQLYEYQVRFVNALHNERKVISMQPRQMGKTQTVAAYILWYVLFNDVKTVAILANKGAASREILSRFQLMYEHLPMFLQQGVKTWNKGDIELENGSKVFTGATSSSGIRGKSCNFLYVDEAAIIPNNVAEEFFTSTYPTISAGLTTKIVLTSTPLGYNHFWKYWNEAVTKINDFVPVEIKYYEHPDRGDKWADEQRKILGDIKFNQEVNCSFLGSSYTLIDASALSKMSPVKPEYSRDDGFDMFASPIPGHTYVVPVDTAKGVGGDYSAFTVIDVTTVPYKIVAKYRNNKIAPLLYPSVVHKVLKDYNDAFVLFELNSSEQVPHILYYEMEYENILFVSKSSKGQTISGGFGSGTTALGLTTDKKTKRIGCNNIKSIIEEGKLQIVDIDMISELSTFIQVKDSYAADEGYNDDLAMTLVIFGWLTTQPYFKELINTDLRREMYQKRMDAIDSEQLPIGVLWTGQEDESVELLNF